MASNKEWIAKIAEINPDAETEGLTNKQLEALYKGLKGDDKEPEQKEDKRAQGYYVKPGCALTTMAGMKAEGELVTAKMVAGGEKTLKALEGKHLEFVK